MAAIKKIEHRTLQFIEAHSKLKEANKMVTHEELAKILGVESKTTITEILKKRQNIQPDQWRLFREHFNIGTEYSVQDEANPDFIVNDVEMVYHIELKTASGKILKIIPEGKSEISLLNAFLEERDRVISTINNEKQARIDELKQDKEDLIKLLNSNLGDISKVQQAIFAMVRSLQQHEAVKASSGNKKKEVDMLGTLSKLNGVNREIDARVDNALVLHKSGKNH